MSNDEGVSHADEQESLERKVRASLESSRSSYNEWAVATGEPLSEFDRMVDDRVEFARADYHKDRASRELEKFSITWDQLTPQHVTSLQELLDRNPQEAEMHRFLEAHPQYLVQVLAGGHGRYQLSKKRLGAEFVPDFLVAQMSSIGIEWPAVEIESPTAAVFRRDGLPTACLNHAIGQIRDWRQWLMDNIDYARRSKERNGLGLIGIDSRAPGLIVIGRRRGFPSRYNEFRRQMIDRERIVIHSYDWLVDVARSNLSGRLMWDLRGRE